MNAKEEKKLFEYVQRLVKSGDMDYYLHMCSLFMKQLGEEKFKELYKKFNELSKEGADLYGKMNEEQFFIHIKKIIEDNSKNSKIDVDKEFIEAVKMINEDKEKAISIYGDPETWSAPGISNISIAESKDEIVEPSEFEIKFKGFKEVDEKTKVYDLVKLIEAKEVYLVIKRLYYKNGFCQKKNDDSKLKDFGLLNSVLNKDRYASCEDFGVFNPLKEIFIDEIIYNYECCVLPAEDIMIYFCEELFNKEQIIKDIHEALNSFVNATLFDSDDVNSYCDDVLRQYIDEEDFEDYDFDEITEFFKRIYFNIMFPKDQIEQKPISPELLDILEKNINEINSLSIFELEDNTRFYNQVIYNIWNYTNMKQYHINADKEYSGIISPKLWYLYDLEDAPRSYDPEISFIYK